METMGFDFCSLPFPYFESQRDELLHYKELAMKRENEIINRQKTLNDQLRDYIETRLEHWESKKKTYIIKEENPLEYVSNYNNDPLISTNFFPSILPVSSDASSSKETNNVTTTGKNKPLLAAKWPTHSYFNQQIANSPTYQQITSTEKPQMPQTNSSMYQQTTSERPLIVPQTNSPVYQQTTSERPLIVPQPPRTNSPMYQQTTSERPLIVPHPPRTNSPMYQQTTSERPLIVPQTNSPMYQQTTLVRPLIVPQAPWTNSPNYQQNTSTERPLLDTQINLFPQQTTRRRRRTSRDVEDPVWKLTAMAKGFLTRRLLQTEKIRDLIKTIKDAEVVLQSLNNPISSQDFDLQQRVINQLQTAKLSLHEIFFVIPVADRMGYITHSRLLRADRRFRKIEENKTNRLSSATLKSLERKKGGGSHSVAKRSHIIHSEKKKSTLDKQIMAEKTNTKTKMKLINHKPVDSNRTTIKSNSHQSDSKRDEGGTSGPSSGMQSDSRRNASGTGASSRMQLDSKRDGGGTSGPSSHIRSDSKRDRGGTSGPSSHIRSDSKRDGGGTSGPSSRIPLPLNKTDPKRSSIRKKPTTTGQVKRLLKK